MMIEEELRKCEKIDRRVQRILSIIMIFLNTIAMVFFTLMLFEKISQYNPQNEMCRFIKRKVQNLFWRLQMRENFTSKI